MAEAVMLESESDSTSLELYLTVWNVKVNFDPTVPDLHIWFNRA